MMEKSELVPFSITTRESKALISLKQNKEIKIQPVDKRNWNVVLSDSIYKQKIVLWNQECINLYMKTVHPKMREITLYT